LPGKSERWSLVGEQGRWTSVGPARRPPHYSAPLRRERWIPVPFPPPLYTAERSSGLSGEPGSASSRGHLNGCCRPRDEGTAWGVGRGALPRHCRARRARTQCRWGPASRCRLLGRSGRDSRLCEEMTAPEVWDGPRPRRPLTRGSWPGLRHRGSGVANRGVRRGKKPKSASDAAPSRTGRIIVTHERAPSGRKAP
jgi:hypothetical protein